ncbi:MAG: hypothetical protein ACRECF_07365 [Methyloceanibacter sp.]
MTRHPIPDAALDDRLGFIGTSGSGKTYNAGGAVERLLHRKARVVIVDPLGVWWGLRLKADGRRPSDLDVVIFGGPHGDLPLNEHAGALIGETAATMSESCIVDLSELGTKAADRRFMTAFLETIYRKAGGEPFHLVVDESDLFAPQKPPKGDETLLNLMEQIVRRGRVKGFIPWLISQRPAVLNKNVLSQVDGLIAFKLTASQDRDALDAWIEGQADKAEGKAIKDSLPAMGVGQGVVWLPGRDVLKTVQFPPKDTFDSSRAPKRGEKKRTAALKPLDLGALKDRLASVEAEVKASDPKALRAELAKAKADIARLEKRPPVSDPAEIERIADGAHAEGFEKGVKLGERKSMVKPAEKLAETCASLLKVVEASHKMLLDAVGKIAADTQALAKRLPPDPPASKGHTYSPLAPKPTPIVRNVHSSTPRTSGATEDRPLGAERRPLAVLAGVHPAGMTEAQWAVAAVLKRTGGTWSTYVSRLRMAGRIERQGDLFYATERGLADVGADAVEIPPPGHHLVDFWAARIPAAGRMLRCLAGFYPNWLSREDLADQLSLTADAGTFGTYLSRLRRPGLIEEDGERRVRASPHLMDGF